MDFIYPLKEEQSKIALCFYILDNLITLHQRKYDKLQNIKKAFLEKMFPKNDSNVPEIRFKGFTDKWELHKLGELNDISSASRVYKDDWRTSGIPFFRSSDVMAAFNRTSNEKAFISEELYEKLCISSGKLQKDDILITGGGSIGTPYIVPNNQPLYSRDADLIWIKDSEKTNARFLYYFFVSPHFRTYLKNISHIGTIAHYTIEQVKETPITLPSIEEQRKIGDHLSNLDHLITLHKCELEKLQNIKNACLEKMFV